MSGIFGMVDLAGGSVPLAAAVRAVAKLRHRGRDDEGYLLANTRQGRVVACRGPDTHPDLADLPPVDAFADEPFDVVLGFRGLSLTSSPGADHQPAGSADGRLHAVFDGSVLNAPELRAELEAAGEALSNDSPAGVPLAGYARWGAGLCRRLVGPFALALLDLPRRRLLLARDHFAVAPLYCARPAGRLAFASEIKALLELPGVTRRVNPRRLYSYLRFSVRNVPWETMFADVAQFPSGHCLDAPVGPGLAAGPRRYWRIDMSRRLDLSLDEAAGRLRELVHEGVRLALRAGGPIGVPVSGGIDSSVVAMAARDVLGPAADIPSVSYVADQPDLNEERWMDLLIAAADTRSHKFRIRPEDLSADVDELVRIQEEPFGGTSIYAHARVCRLAAARGVRVLLDGQGVDELLADGLAHISARLASLLLAGRWVRARRLWRHAGALPGSSPARVLMHLAAAMLPPGAQEPLRGLVGKAPAPAWLNQAWFRGRGVGPPPRPMRYGRRMLRLALRATTEFGLAETFRPADRNAAAAGVVFRIPLLTPRLAELVFALPEEYVVSPRATTKHVLRESMRGRVPDAILDRRGKIGFGTPELDWLTALTPSVDAILSGPGAARMPVLNARAARDDWREVRAGRRGLDFRVWRWVNLIKWAEAFDISFDP